MITNKRLSTTVAFKSRGSNGVVVNLQSHQAKKIKDP